MRRKGLIFLIMLAGLLPLSADAQAPGGNNDREDVQDFPAGRLEFLSRVRKTRRLGTAGSLDSAISRAQPEDGVGVLSVPDSTQEAQQEGSPRAEAFRTGIQRPDSIANLYALIRGEVPRKLNDDAIDLKVTTQMMAWHLTNPAAAGAINASVSGAVDTATYLTEQRAAFYDYLERIDPYALLELQGCEARAKAGKRGNNGGAAGGGAAQKDDFSVFLECVVGQQAGGSGSGASGPALDQAGNGDPFKPQDKWRFLGQNDGANGGGGAGGAGGRAMDSTSRQASFVPGLSGMAGAGALGGGGGQQGQQEMTLVGMALGDHVLDGGAGTGIGGTNNRQLLGELRTEIRRLLGDFRIEMDTKGQTSARKFIRVDPTEPRSRWVPEKKLGVYRALARVMFQYCEFKRANQVNAGRTPLEKVSFWAALGGGGGGGGGQGGGVQVPPEVIHRLHAGNWSFSPNFGDLMFTLFQRETVDRELRCDPLQQASTAQALPREAFANAAGAVLGGIGAVGAANNAPLTDWQKAFELYADLVSKAQMLGQFAHLENMMMHFAVDEHDRFWLFKSLYNELNMKDGESLLMAREKYITRLSEFAAALGQATQSKVGVGSLFAGNQNGLVRSGPDFVKSDQGMAPN